ncbi:MAG: hypothetical protein ACLGIC_00255 [Acidimicrobiia bacterium]
MSQHHDPVVGDALRRLDVPEHGPDFWDRLETRLADDHAGTDAPPTTAEEETTVVDIRDRAERRVADRRRAPLPALAAAVAVVVALVVGAAVLSAGGDEESQLDTAGETAETTVPDTAPPAPEDDSIDSADTTVPPETTTTTAPAADAQPAEDRAQAWLEELFAGDVEGAYAMLDDTSQERMPLEEFEQMGAGLFEGAATFATADVSRTVQEVDTQAGPVSVVTFTGDVEREGMVETASYPVIVTDTGIHFTLGGSQVELDPEYVDSSGTTLASPLEIIVTEGSDAWIGYDGGPLEPLAGRGELSIDVEAAAGPGTHLVTLLAERDGLLVARTPTVVVP